MSAHEKVGQRTYRFHLPTLADDAARLAGTLVVDEAAACDAVEREIRQGMTAAAREEGDPAPSFRRDGDFLFIQATEPAP